MRDTYDCIIESLTKKGDRVALAWKCCFEILGRDAVNKWVDGTVKWLKSEGYTGNELLDTTQYLLHKTLRQDNVCGSLVRIKDEESVGAKMDMLLWYLLHHNDFYDAFHDALTDCIERDNKGE